jgi:hypothetical protein
MSLIILPVAHIQPIRIEPAFRFALATHASAPTCYGHHSVLTQTRRYATHRSIVSDSVELGDITAEDSALQERA